MDRHPRLVVMGASAGGVDALTEVFRELPADFPGAVAVVLHVAASSPSLLPHILDRAAHIPVAAATDGAIIEAGHAYVAVPDQHLLVHDGHLRLEPSARVNGHRPAVDPLFCSAAEELGEQVAGVVLSGSRDDGTIGLARIRRAGGACFVQDPEEARHPSMPRSALENVGVATALPARELARALDDWARNGTPATNGEAGTGAQEADGDPLTTICPECGGVLQEHDVDGVPYWECHVGHMYAPRTLADRQGADVEAALWTAVRTLEDRQALLERLAKQAEARGQRISATHFRRQGEVSSEQADSIRETIAALTVVAGLGDTLAVVEEAER